MVGYANKLLFMEQEAIADITGKKAPLGTISVRGPEAIIDCYFPALIQKTLAQYPGARFDISNCLENNIENELQTDAIDLAFIFSDYISSSKLITEKILTEKLIMAALPAPSFSRKDDSRCKRPSFGNIVVFKNRVRVRPAVQTAVEHPYG